MKTLSVHQLKMELAAKSKKGIDFILAAALIWIAIAYLWSIPNTAYQKSIYVFIIGSSLLPLALGFSKLLKTNWKVPHNPLQPLGLWLNFAQLFYFPFLVFVLIVLPDYFVMTYAIITGAHLFPYAWFYDDNTYAIIAAIISAFSLIMGLNLQIQSMYWIPLFTGFMLLLMFVILYKSIPKTIQKWEENSRHVME